ncbi:glycosyltransferase [Bordetella ansorpii]|uniref:Glycosyltransferase n=1 Tax=Bordetella ansorpii TaxID=288768 RepID=A0A157M9C1_9BORD|nr:glycosyltransferase family 2 protein [Bordetella ansorpii]SAI05657.1 glycosyltransferase [Bordetella ansorpii]
MAEEKRPGAHVPQAGEALSIGGHADEVAHVSLARYRELQLHAQALEHRNNELAVALHQAQIKALVLNHKFRDARSGFKGVLAAPLSLARSLQRRLSGRYRLQMAPVHQLEAHKNGQWLVTGDTPQCLLIADLRWQRLQGWYWLDLRVTEADDVLDAAFFFDIEGSAGFIKRHSVNVRLQARKNIRIPFYVPANCRAIRFDPCHRATRFGLRIDGLVRLDQQPAVAGGNETMMRRWALLGGGVGNWAVLSAKGHVAPAIGDDYQWRSEGIDPWFQVRTPDDVFKAGWYKVDLALNARVRRGISKLYMNFGDGYNEADSASLPYESGQTTSRVVRFHGQAKALRFDPVECETAFSIEGLAGTPISAEQARQVILTKLSAEHEDFFGQPSDDIWAALTRTAGSSGKDPLAMAYEAYQALHVQGRNTSDYPEWIEANEGQWFDEDLVRRQREQFVLRPLISIVMPTYNTPLALLRIAIDSVLAQSYPDWQLCIADDDSTDAAVRETLDAYARQDPRIRVVFRPSNGHISEASNTALALADGQYVALLDHDDQLAEHALHYVVHYLNQHPQAKIVYTDEDKIDIKGERFDPHFKPDWNPDLCFSQNYVSHLGIYRRDILQQIGGFRTEVVGSQDHDLLLRCLPLVKPSEIIHVPMVLYHWRAVRGSTAQAGEHKGYTAEAGIRALQDFMDSQGDGQAIVEEGLAPNTYRVRYPVAEPGPLVSLLIPTRDKVDLLQACVSSILEKTEYRNFEIIIIDNGSELPETIDYLEKIQKAESSVRVVPYTHPFNYSAINNFGARHARGEILGLVNNDVEVITPGWLTEMVSHAIRPHIGCVGAKLYYGDDTIQHAGVIIGLGGVAGHSHRYSARNASGYFYRLKVIQNLSAVTAACLLVRKSVFMEVGGLEESLRVAFNDVDFCLKVRKAGYRNLWTPYAELYHYESKSRGHEDTPEKMARFVSEIAFMQQRWGDELKNDPCYSRNLTLAREDFSF